MINVCKVICIIRKNIALLVLLFVSGLAQASDMAVALVAKKDSQIPVLENFSIRRIYLGVPYTHNGTTIHPVLNRSDEQLYQEFLQKVLFLSENAYRRRLFSSVVRAKGFTPREYNNLPNLVEALLTDPSSISVMRVVDAKRYPQLRIINVLWENR